MFFGGVVKTGRAIPWPGHGGTSPRSVSVSTQIAALRRLLVAAVSKDEETGMWRPGIAVPETDEGDAGHHSPVIDVGRSDLLLKTDIERQKGTRRKVVFSGASEAHLPARDR